jgi:hypothetical protein
MAALADLDPSDAAARLVAEHDDEWLARLADALDRRLAGRGLERVMRTWGLSRTELGTMFGVTRQAVSRWLDDGVPADRAVAVADVEAITDLLERYLKRERIPAVVRRAAPRLGDQSLLALTAAGHHAEALRLTREMFAFTDAHA